MGTNFVADGGAVLFCVGKARSKNWALWELYILPKTFANRLGFREYSMAIWNERPFANRVKFICIGIVPRLSEAIEWRNSTRKTSETYTKSSDEYRDKPEFDIIKSHLMLDRP